MRRILFFTGAGISADSGISTFRDNEDGLWTKYNPDVVANITTFKQNKDLVFKFYNERRAALKDVRPNKAHLCVSELQRRYGVDRVLVFTQNIDDLFEKAGCESVYHVHGDITEMRCLSDSSHIIDIGYDEWALDRSCPTCGGEMKPNVIFFGEQAPMYGLLYHVFSTASKGDMIVVIGTSGNVIPINHIIGSRTDQLRGGHRLLCNKDSNDWIPYENFDTLLFGSVVNHIDTICVLATDWINEEQRTTHPVCKYEAP